MGNKNDSFGNRMKVYEKMATPERFMPLLPVIARLDGKNFSRWTRDLQKPFDLRMSRLMARVTKKLVEETNACMGYTQSDEITLAWYSKDPKSQIFMDGKIQKMISVLSSMATAIFNNEVPKVFAGDIRRIAFFDCRVWQVPNLEEGANAFLWREKDATKNSVQSLARTLYSHNQLMNKSCNEMQEMIFQKGDNWNNYPSFFKRGIFIQKRVVIKSFSKEELSELPEKHEARKNPHMTFKRTVYAPVEMPPFSKVMNRPEVIFFGVEPLTIDFKKIEVKRLTPYTLGSVIIPEKPKKELLARTKITPEEVKESKRYPSYKDIKKVIDETGLSNVQVLLLLKETNSAENAIKLWKISQKAKNESKQS